MDGKVFGTSVYFIVFLISIHALQSFHHIYPHDTCQIRIFPIRFNTSPPSGIAINIDGGCPHSQTLITLVASCSRVSCIFGPRLIRYCRINGMYGVGFKGSGHSYGLWKDCSQSASCHSVQGLIPPIIRFDAQSFDRFGVVHH